MDTGVPHVVLEHMDIESLEISRLAPPIRSDQRFVKGTNVNWLQIINETTIKVRTFERGVEGETLSCGTGLTACAYAYWKWVKHEKPLTVQTRGGELKLEKNKSGAVMTGPVRLVFKGEFESDIFV
jgi:diaminopimelate epimerase